MRVGMDVSATRHGLTNGVAVYTANLARELLGLEVELVAWFCARASGAAERFLEKLAARGAKVVRAPPPWRWSPDGAWWLPVGPPLRPLLERVDVWHVGEFHLPPPSQTPCVATVHDLTTLTHPEHHQWINRLVHRRRLRWVQAHATRVISVSRSTAADLEALTGIDPARVSVIHEARGHYLLPHATNADSARQRYGLAPRYILSVGTLEPRKNHARLVQAFEGLPTRFSDVELVITGSEGWGARKIRREIESSPARPRIRLLGQVPDTDLISLYAEALVFAYPSLYEGFGLPVLEAMAVGTPVLTSDVSSLPEVAGMAGLQVDPRSVESIRSGLRRLIEDPHLRDRLANAGRKREAAFSWKRTARETVEAYREALGPARADVDG